MKTVLIVLLIVYALIVVAFAVCMLTIALVGRKKVGGQKNRKN